MNKLLLFICTFFIICMPVKSFDATSYAIGSMSRASGNSNDGEYTNLRHVDTDKVEFTRKLILPITITRVFIFTYHYCGMKYHGSLWMVKNNKMYLQQKDMFLCKDPAEMSLEELRQALR